MLGLDQRCDVYTRHATTGLFTVVAHSAVPCRLALLGAQPGDTGDERAELAPERRLLWGPTPALPSEHVRVTVDGESWQIVAGTVAAVRGPTGAVAYRRADCVRAV